MTDEEIHVVEKLIGHRFQDRALLQRAFTHASVVSTRSDSNERLEFLGDAVLGIVVCDYLFSRYEDLQEGEMTKIKSTVVSRQSCGAIAEAIGLGEFLRLGKGMSNRASLPVSVVAAVYEAVVGALYVDGGIEVARAFILGHMQDKIEHADRSGHQFNFKSVLQQTVQQQQDQTPQYIILDEKGPDHSKCFEVCVELGARRFTSCWGASKKAAEQQAAVEALIELGLAERLESGDIRICELNDVEA